MDSPTKDLRRARDDVNLIRSIAPALGKSRALALLVCYP